MTQLFFLRNIKRYKVMILTGGLSTQITYQFLNDLELFCP